MEGVVAGLRVDGGSSSVQPADGKYRRLLLSFFSVRVVYKR